MKINNFTKGLLTITALSMSLLSCSKDDDNTNPVNDATFKGIIVATGITNADGASGKVYLQAIPELNSQSYNNANAQPSGFGAGPIAFNNGHIYSLPDYMGNTRAEIIRYSADGNGTLTAQGRLSIPAGAAACNIVELNDTKAYVSCQNTGQIIVFNPTTMTKISDIDLTMYSTDTTRVAPASMIIRDGQLFVGLSQFDSQWMPKRKAIEVAVINTATDAVEKVIVDETHGMSVATRPIDPRSIFMDEEGDIYINCVASFGYMPNFPGGIVRIKKGATEIDPTYSIPLNTTKVSGLEGDYVTFIGSICYAGNGIAYANANAPQTDPSATNPYTSFTNITMKIDLRNKTIERLSNLPLTNPHGAAVAMHQGKLILGSTSKTANGLYIYNPQTNQVERFISMQGAPSYIYSFDK